jgi:hypothetical protein
MNEFYLTIRVRVVPSKDLQMRSFLQEHVNKQLRNWDDGRYPFAAEQVFDGIERMVKTAAYYGQIQKSEATGRNRLVATSDTSSATQAHLDALALLNGLTIHVDAEEIETL